ncbi:autophagy-related protein 18h-like isoform X2 [Chenopodium quinoa]|uniref:autophagy-related protein 18h-like isoform X1 n=1 Tax=Chenopodium quinoa TaxID=63459 RepID=UPI000B79ADCF|nr:autophagy-related protein 18h-like isoform X1 [Chenopodium quinoa]XP_021742468.1 autophagy-related protein 18h-like isoform X2 [Chenopodium quinoa]
MKHQQTKGIHNKTNGFSRNSFKFISSCIKTVSSGVRSASASVAASISSDSNGIKDQVLWACFDKIELSPSIFKRVLLLGYTNGFQVLDVDDASIVTELVSRRDGPCTFLQIQPFPAMSEGCEGFGASHPLLLVAAGDEAMGPDSTQRRRDGLVRDGYIESQTGNVVNSPTAVRFYSLRSHSYVHVLRFRSAVLTVRCSPRIVAVGLASQIYCFDALTLENKFSVLTYPVPQMAGLGMVGINVGYGPMDVGPRWLAYASNNPLLTNTGRLSPQSLTPSPGVSPSTSPSGGNMVARYAMESSKQLAAGLINLGDMSYKTFSKYCNELLPDGSNSPVTSSSGWRVNKTSANSPETDTAGMVIVKDFVSRAVIAHFRAHTSPISALCFDPSGTLLVTASIHGNNINIFRIMPSSSKNGTGSQNYNWTTSHVHLYKLHRGFTTAVIQDICFSQYSQWVAIISSKGTCHIYVLSPFGGECGLQVRNSHVDGPTLVPVLSLPWWSTSSYTVNQQSLSIPPPPPVTLSVVSRIRTGNSGWLNTVSSAASSAAGMGSAQPSAVSAVFHCSMPSGSSRGRSLEHLLVYSPCGHLIQYGLIPSMGVDTTDTAPRTGSGSLAQIQDDDLRVKSEVVHWWDVCRRVDWPEREESIKGISFGAKEPSEMVLETSDFEDNDNSGKGEELHEQSTLYLSNAEVQMNYGRMPSWQNSKIHFFAMNSMVPDNQKSFVDDNIGGEIEIEKVSHLEIEIKRKDLLPVFEHFHNVKPDWNNRGAIGYSTSRSESHLADDKYPSPAIVHPQTVQNSHFGSFAPDAQMDAVKSYLGIAQNQIINNGMKVSSKFPSPLLTQNSLKTDDTSTMEISPPENSCLVNSPSPVKNASLSAERANSKEVQSSSSVGGSEASNVSSNRSDFSMNVADESSVQDPLDFGGFFEEEYCKAGPLDESHELSEVVTDVDSSSSPREKEKSEEDGENDELLGGVFAFSEEG